MSVSVGIIGVSGYSGLELARILAGHGQFRVAFASSDKFAGNTIGSLAPVAGVLAELPIITQAAAADRFGEVELVFLCTPPEASIELAPRILAAGHARVVDLSGGFRLPAAAYPRWYGFAHGAPEALAEAVYSLPEATGNRERLRAARLVSNPGCYPTAAALPLIPLLRAGLVRGDGIVIDAKSGTTGAGRKATEAFSFSEVADDFRAYRVLQHQHTPEIENILRLADCGDLKVTFTPHLLPVKRGILSTAYARLAPEHSAQRGSEAASAAVQAALREFAAGQPFLRVVAPDKVSLRSVVGTNLVVMGAAADVERGCVVVVSAEDNLVKGAAGQAVQNANLMFGFAETTGLDTLSGYAP